MFCTQCGKQVAAADRFCPQCGAAQSPSRVPPAARRLVRPYYGRKIAGVALGFANYLDLDVTLARILWVLFTLLSGGIVLLAYLVAWILMPEEDYLPARLPAQPATEQKKIESLNP